MGVDDVQVGSAIRAVRIRRGLTQAQVAAAAGVSRPMVSLVESGGLERTSLGAVRRIAAAVGMSLQVVPRWRGADLAKLLDEDHAGLVNEVVRRLTSLGWETIPEHSFNVWGEQGSIDVMGWYPPARALLIVEVKTKLVDLQDLLSKMDRKRRLCPTLARELGWRPLVVGSVLVLPEQTWARSAVDRFGPVFAAALPARTSNVRRWLRHPDRDLRAIWFLLNDTPGDGKRHSRCVMRVRPRRLRADGPIPRSIAPSSPRHGLPEGPAAEVRPRSATPGDVEQRNDP